MKTIAVIGASGSTGRLACEHANAAGADVIAIDRDEPDPADRLEDVRYRRADVLKGDLTSALEGCDAVISTLGLPFTAKNALDPPPLYTRGTERIIQTMNELNIRRLAVISAAFVTEQPALPTWFSMTVVPALSRILDQMREMERTIETNPALDWTIVRPGWLLDEPAQGTLLTGEERLPEGAFRCREGDLARFLVESVLEDRHIGRKPAIGAPETHEHESPAALGEALLEMLPKPPG